MTQTRFTDFDPAGNSIPGSPNMVASVGVTVGKEVGWFGAAKLRHFGPRPLIEDSSVRSSGTTLVNARAGYRFENKMRIQVDAFNLFNVKQNQIEYWYESRIQPAGVAADDRHIHPVEPLAIRVTLAGPL